MIPVIQGDLQNPRNEMPQIDNHIIQPQSFVNWYTSVKISEAPLTTGTFNKTTGVLCACTTDGRVVLTHARSLGSDDPPISAIQLSTEAITRIRWVNNHEFVISGPGEPLALFNIIGQSRTVFNGLNSTTTALSFKDGMLCVGALDGYVTLYDLRSPARTTELARALHTYRGKVHPICGLETYENYLYTTTSLRGRLWLWDRRNMHRKLNLVETGQYPCSIQTLDRNVYILEHSRLLRFSETLSLREVLCTDNNEEIVLASQLSYFSRSKKLVWNRPGKLCCFSEPYQRIRMENMRPTVYFVAAEVNIECKGVVAQHIEHLSGFDSMGSNKILGFTDEGTVLAGKIVQDFVL